VPLSFTSSAGDVPEYVRVTGGLRVVASAMGTEGLEKPDLVPKAKVTAAVEDISGAVCGRLS
jgi:hypothetical protein